MKYAVTAHGSLQGFDSTSADDDSNSDMVMAPPQEDPMTWMMRLKGMTLSEECQKRLNAIIAKATASEDLTTEEIAWLQAAQTDPGQRVNCSDSSGIPNWVIWGGAAAAGALLIFLIANSKKRGRK